MVIDKQHERRIDQEWDGVKKELQVLLEKSMNYSTYLIMKNISKNMTVIKEKTAILTKNSKYFSFNLYTRIPLPNQLPNYSPIEIIFDDSLPDKIVIPYRIDLRTMVVRYMIFKYDHKTWTCETYKDPDCPDEYEVDMKTYCDHLWLAKQKMKFRRHPVKKGKAFLNLNSSGPKWFRLLLGPLSRRFSIFTEFLSLVGNE